MTHLHLFRYVDQLGSVDDMDPLAAPPLVSLVEEPKGGMGIDEKVSIALISVSASTGDVTWDHFEGKFRISILPAMPPLLQYCP